MAVLPPRAPAPASRRLAAAALAVSALLLTVPAHAQPVVCHVAWAGATRSFVIEPIAHGTSPVPLLHGASVVLEVANRLPPAPGAGVTVRTFGLHDGQPYLLHQASYLPRALHRTSPHGFTGLQVVREPTRGHELSYWCEAPLRRPRADARR